MTKLAVSRRESAIGSYRFLFAVIVCLYHFQTLAGFSAPTAFSGAFPSVDFYALVSGYFLMPSIQRAADRRREGASALSLAGEFTLRRFLRLYPHYILTLVPFLALRVFILHTLTVKECLLDGFFDFFMLQALGSTTVIFLFWYVSSLFLASVLLYWLALLLKDHFVPAAAFGALFILSWFCRNTGTIDHILFPGIWRLAAGLGLGCVIHQLVRRWKPALQGRFSLMSSLWELLLLSGILLLMWRGGRDHNNFIVLALLFLLVLSVFLGNSRLSHLLNNPASAFLGQVSYGYYLNQCFFIHLFGRLLQAETFWPVAGLFLAGNLILSAATTWLCRWGTARLQALWTARRPQPQPEAAAPARTTRAVEAYRFLFAVVIALYHFRSKGAFGPAPTAFIRGYLGVEFFTLVSGFFLMHTIQKAQKEGGAPLPAVGSFARRRFLRLYPHYILTLAVFLFLRIFILRTCTLRDCLTDGFFDFFMLQSVGSTPLVYLLWYPSALFLACVLLYWLALLLKDHFAPAAAFGALLILSWFYRNTGSIDHILYPGLWRLMAELGLGCILSLLVQRCRPFFQGRLPLLSTLFELTLLAAILLLCWCCSRDERDFLALALLILLLFSVLLGHSGLSRLLDNPLSAFLGQISYGFYLNQCFFLHIFGPVIPVRPYWRTAALFLACNFVLSILTYYLSQGVAALLRRGADSLCRPSDR